MSHVYAFLSGLMLVLSAEGQSVYFVSIDSDDQEAYKVTLGKKTYASDAFGHLVIPQLKDSLYPFSVQFSSDKYPAHIFLVRIDKSDRGFQLKKKSAGQWVLYDWQKMELLQNEQSASAELTPKDNRRSDEFARLMAAVVNDSSILIHPEQAVAFLPSAGGNGMPASPPVGMLPPSEPSAYNKAIAHPAASDSLAKNDLAGSKGGNASSTVAFSDRDAASLASLPLQGKVEKLLDNTAADFRQQLYRDSSSSGIDSVMVRIPIGNADINENRFSFQSASQGKQGEGHATRQPIAIDTDKDTISKKAVVSMVNSDCRSFATDADIDKLRVKMMEQAEALDRIETARKMMRTRCLSTGQVRALTELFSTDESRYRFFDAAYPYVSDSDRFRDLIDEMSDVYFIARFKALVRY